MEVKEIGFAIFFKSFLVFLLFCLVCFVCAGCAKKSSEQNSKIDEDKSQNEKNNLFTVIKCWDLKDDINSYPKLFNIREENYLSKEEIPWAGTVSHHLLAGDLIDRWFNALSKNAPDIKNFFIICPSHWGFSSNEWSLGKVVWKTQHGMVFSNEKIVEELAQKLDVSLENEVFFCEHGINTLIPFISKYYSDVKIVPLALKYPEPPLNQEIAKKLLTALLPYFSDDFCRQNFLLISTDFSHHGNLQETYRKDEMSMIFFRNPTAKNWIFCGCDNRPGLYVLSHLLKPDTKVSVCFHTNSFEISGQDENDITSYFFSYFY